MHDLLSIRKRHAKLQSELASNSKVDVDEVRALLRDIAELARHPESISEYLWLHNTMEQWRSAGSVLKIEADAWRMPPPPNLPDKPPPKRVVWWPNNLDKWLELKAFSIWKQRALEWYSNRDLERILNDYRNSIPPDEADRLRVQDVFQAELYLALDLLDGRIDLVQSLSPDSYVRMERRWLSEIKELKAYLFWKARGGGWDDGARIDDFGRACRDLERSVRDPSRKAPQSSFEPFQRYIERELLTPEGKLDEGKQRVRDGVGEKARRLAIATSSAEWKNLPAATGQMQRFYENIGRAVLGAREDASLRVAEALGRRPGFEGNEAIVNCFEMALAIYFLDPESA